MNIEGWKYYNHAAIPTTAPHESVNLKPIEDGSIWKIKGALLARWQTEWDSVKETNWWYIICDAPFDLNKLSKKSRKNIRKSLDNCDVKKIEVREFLDELWCVFQEASKRYKNYTVSMTKDDYCQDQLSKPDNCEFWAGFDKESGKMIGYKVVTVYDEWADFTISKYSTDYLKLRVSDALNYVTLNYYLNEQHKNYVSNGSRSIVHETNVQDYYEEHFNFRKAFCKLCIKYRFPFNIAVKILYPFRRIIMRFNKGKLHNIASLLYMEELRHNKI